MSLIPFRTLCDSFSTLEQTSKRLAMTDQLAELFAKIAAADARAIDKAVYLCQGQLAPSFRNIEFQMSEKLMCRALAEAFDRPERDIEI